MKNRLIETCKNPPQISQTCHLKRHPFILPHSTGMSLIVFGSKNILSVKNVELDKKIWSQFIKSARSWNLKGFSGLCQFFFWTSCFVILLFIYSIIWCQMKKLLSCSNVFFFWFSLTVSWVFLMMCDFSSS